MHKRLIPLLLLLAACANTPAYSFKGGTLSPPAAAADIVVPDQNGQPFRLSEQVGKVVLLFFGYTHCPDVCPTTMSDYKAVKQQLGADANKVRFVMVTVDPARDTPAIMSRYLGIFDPSFVGLSPTPEQLATLTKAYNITYELDAPDARGNYAVAHSAISYAIDRSGQLRVMYPFGMGASAMTEDVRYLLANR